MSLSGWPQVNELAEQLVAEVADAEDLCLSYQEVLVFVGVSKQHAEKLGVTRQQVNRCVFKSAVHAKHIRQYAAPPLLTLTHSLSFLARIASSSFFCLRLAFLMHSPIFLSSACLSTPFSSPPPPRVKVVCRACESSPVLGLSGGPIRRRAEHSETGPRAATRVPNLLGRPTGHGGRKSFGAQGTRVPQI